MSPDVLVGIEEPLPIKRSSKRFAYTLLKERMNALNEEDRWLPIPEFMAAWAKHPKGSRLSSISAASATIRDLRKPRYGGFKIKAALLPDGHERYCLELDPKFTLEMGEAALFHEARPPTTVAGSEGGRIRAIMASVRKVWGTEGGGGLRLARLEVLELLVDNGVLEYADIKTFALKHAPKFKK